MGIPPGPAPAKKSNPLMWVLVGCGGLLLLIALVVAGGVAYLAHNPAAVLTKMITASNPNVEVVSVNKDSQRIVLRDKHTGKTYSISFADARGGKFTMRDDSGRASVTIGGGAAKVPAWVPDYPGSEPQAAFSAQGNEGESGTFTFKAKDSADKVIKFYQDQFQALGMQITTNVTHQEAQSSGGMLVAQDEAKKHTVTVIIGVAGPDTTVAVTYVTNK